MNKIQFYGDKVAIKPIRFAHQFYKGTVVPFGIHTIQKTCGFLSESYLGSLIKT